MSQEIGLQKNVTFMPTRPQGVERDAYARPPKLSLALGDLDL